VTDDCCLRHLNPAAVTEGDQDRAITAPALEFASIEFTAADSHPERLAGRTLTHVPVPQLPPLVLRT